jgi:hypothetical protein
LERGLRCALNGCDILGEVKKRDKEKETYCKKGKGAKKKNLERKEKKEEERKSGECRIFTWREDVVWSEWLWYITRGQKREKTNEKYCKKGKGAKKNEEKKRKRREREGNMSHPLHLWCALNGRDLA